MKKFFLPLLLAAVCTTSAFAQFNKGKKYVNASLAGAGISYSERDDLSFGLGVNAGYMIEDNWMLLGEVGLDYSDSKWRSLSVGAKGRYYIEQNGLFLGAGVKWLHEYKNVNDIQLTPEVGYCFFLNKNVTIEPSVYYDMSLTDFGDYSKFGVKIGIGVFF